MLEEAVHGQSLVLSLDTDLQSICEDELARSVTDCGAKSGSVLILDPNTGDILAAASWPLLETRSRPPRGSPGLWINRNFTDQFEPGSVFKIFSTASLLRNSAIDTATVFNCDNDQGDRNLRPQRSAITTTDNLSADAGLFPVEQRLLGQGRGQPAPGRTLPRPDGFRIRPGHLPALPGQPAGILRPVSNWSGRSMQTIAIGQEVAVTALQLGMAVCSVANGGILYAPRMVREIRDDRGRVIEEIQPAPLRRVMAPPLAELLREAMGRVVLEGTGQGAGMDWITTGGKTGTAQKSVDGKGYTPGAYVASFAGMVPLENPRLVILTVLDEPEGIHHYAAQSAVPLFASIIKGHPAFHRLADGRSRRRAPRSSLRRTTLEMVAVPDVLHLSVTRAAQRLGGGGFPGHRSGKGRRGHPADSRARHPLPARPDGGPGGGRSEGRPGGRFFSLSRFHRHEQSPGQQSGGAPGGAGGHQGCGLCRRAEPPGPGEAIDGRPVTVKMESSWR